MASIVQLMDGVVANRFNIEGSGLKFGRTGSNQVTIDDLAVSAEHAQITILKDERGVLKYVLEDLGSTNGSFINEQKVEGQQLLRHKDIVRIGWNNFTFVNDDEVDMEKTRVVKKSWIPGVYFSDD